MMGIIIISFAIAACFGIILLTKVFSEKKPRKILVIAHGVFAALSITLLAIQVINGSDDKILNLIAFVFVAMIGFYMLYREFFSKQNDLVKSAVPKPVALAHAVAAVAAFVFLLINYFGSTSIN